MPRQLYVNLPVKDLQRSVEFFAQLGFSFNPQFTDENASCMIVSPEINVMLLTEKFFAGFAPRPVSDATRATEVLLALSTDSRAEVDELVRKAVAAGGSTYSEPREHGGFMYQHGFADPDGHVWEVFHMSGAPG